MPRGKYVNHKGRSRHFTSPEELQQQSSDEEESSTSSGEEEAEIDGAAGTSSKKPRAKPKARSTGDAKKDAATASSDDSDEESSEGEDRDARKGVASLIEIENPNRVVKKATQKLQNVAIEGEKPAKPELTRREREQLEKQKARQRYEKLHAAGKTTEAKADLARLALIRQQRADAAAKREAEKKAVDDKKSTSKA